MQEPRAHASAQTRRHVICIHRDIIQQTVLCMQLRCCAHVWNSASKHTSFLPEVTVQHNCSWKQHHAEEVCTWH